MWVGAVVVVGLLGLLGLSGSQERAVGVVGTDSAVKKVECDKGQTLTDALKKAKPGDTLQVTGTCHERVTIATDRLTLDGHGSAVLDGGGGGPTEFEGVVTIDGAHGVTLTGFTIQNGPGEGILGQRGAAFTILDTTVQGNAGTGIAISGGSTAELVDCSVRSNGLVSTAGGLAVGIDVFTGATVILRGSIVIAQNPGSGINVFGGSMMELRGATVQLIDNGAAGLVIGGGSNLATFLFTASQGSMLTVNNHFVAGIIALDATLELFNSPITISAANNGIGIWLIQNSYITNASPLPGAVFLLEDNGVGLQLEGGSGAQIVGGPLTVRNNVTGVLADGAGTLTLVSGPPGPSSVQNNGTDVDLRFGTRATFQDVAIGTITCDATVLSRGSTVCP
jgi:hypothetical protein